MPLPHLSTSAGEQEVAQDLLMPGVHTVPTLAHDACFTTLRYRLRSNNDGSPVPQHA
jgi:hypothetical protein